MAMNFYRIGYHFEKFRSQVAVRKKLFSRPVKFSFIPEKTRHNPVLISVFLEKS